MRDWVGCVGWGLFALVLGACGDDGRTRPSVDAGARDAGRSDLGSVDSGIGDAGSADAGRVDSGPGDGGPADGGPIDAGTPDAGACEESPCRLVSPQCGCGAGEGCTLDESSARVCLPSGPVGEGGDCGAMACAPGLVCGESPDFDVCLRFCTTDADCAGGGAGSRCLVDFGVARACTVGCDPVDDTGCPAGAGCTILETAAGSGDYFTNCRPAGVAPTGVACTSEVDCVGGNSCRAAGAGRACTAWCRGDDDCGGGLCGPELTIGTTTYGSCG